MNTRFSVVGALACLFAISGCTGQELYKAQLVDPPEGSNFDQNLHAGYMNLAEDEYAEGDYLDSDAFARRAKQIAQGGEVDPEEIGDRTLPKENVAELTEAREDLVAALAAGASSIDPANAAEAQVYFDCWMQEQEENWQSEDIAACRSKFHAAMDNLVPALVASKAKPRSVRFVVYFKTDQSSIDAEGQAVIEEAKAAVAKLGTPIVRISGNADTVGPVDYNQTLSELRAQAVSKVFEGGATPVRALVTEGNGELVPALITPDETAEQRNRRVEIILEP